jgi:hypothetical protein
VAVGQPVQGVGDGVAVGGVPVKVGVGGTGVFEAGSGASTATAWTAWGDPGAAHCALVGRAGSSAAPMRSRINPMARAPRA